MGIFATLQFGTRQEEVAFSDLVKDVNDGKVAKIVESGSSLSIYMKDDDGNEEEYPSKTSRIPTGASANEQGLDISKVKYEVTPPDTTSDILWNLAIIFLPVLVMVALFVSFLYLFCNLNLFVLVINRR